MIVRLVVAVHSVAKTDWRSIDDRRLFTQLCSVRVADNWSYRRRVHGVVAAAAASRQSEFDGASVAAPLNRGTEPQLYVYTG